MNKEDLPKEAIEEWEKWLLERPEHVRKIAEKIVPWKWYKLATTDDEIGNRYSPRSYQEHTDGSITITCEKKNDEIPILGGYGVFGIKPEDLIEDEEND